MFRANAQPVRITATLSDFLVQAVTGQFDPENVDKLALGWFCIDTICFDQDYPTTAVGGCERWQEYIRKHV